MTRGRDSRLAVTARVAAGLRRRQQPLEVDNWRKSATAAGSGYALNAHILIEHGVAGGQMPIQLRILSTE
jgi:hypothetical protein